MRVRGGRCRVEMRAGEGSWGCRQCRVRMRVGEGSWRCWRSRVASRWVRAGASGRRRVRVGEGGFEDG